MKKILIGVILSIFLCGCIEVIDKENENVKISEIYYQKNNTHTYKDFYLESNDILILLNNGSWAICNEKNNTYIFQAIELGDWDYTVNNKKELENIIKTYISIQNNGTY